MSNKVKPSPNAASPESSTDETQAPSTRSRRVKSKLKGGLEKAASGGIAVGLTIGAPLVMTHGLLKLVDDKQKYDNVQLCREEYENDPRFNLTSAQAASACADCKNPVPSTGKWAGDSTETALGIGLIATNFALAKKRNAILERDQDGKNWRVRVSDEREKGGTMSCAGDLGE